MSSDTSNQSQHALSQLADARSRARRGLTEYQQRWDGASRGPHPNLVRTDSDEPPIEVMATAAAAEYIGQLRPYRDKTERWKFDLGVVELPRRIDRGDRKGLKRGQTRPLILKKRSTRIELSDLDDVVKALNKTVTYHSEGETEKFSFVLPPADLLTLTGVADDVAADLGLLASISEGVPQTRIDEDLIEEVKQWRRENL